ncbi:MAG: VOC family protein [Anaerolineaceae bacterium]
MKIRKIHHVGIGVSDLNNSIEFWCNTIGLHLDRIEEVPSHKVQVAFLPVGDCVIELVLHLDKDLKIGDSAHSIGEGLDHLCLEVDNLDEALMELKEKHVRLIDDTPKILPGRKLAFVHPDESGGVLLEFYEMTNK